MALKTVTIPSSGNIYGSNGHHEFKLVVTEESTDTNTNKSTMSYTFSIKEKSGHSGYVWNGWGTSISYSVVIGDKTFTGYIPNYTADSSSTWTTISSSSSGFTIDHSTDGTKTISISFSVSDTTGKSYTCGTASGSLSSWALTTIPRASTLSLSASYILINSSNYSSGNLICTVTNLTGKYTSLTWRVSGVKPDGYSATSAWQTPSTQPGTNSSKTINISFESILKAEKNIISNCIVEVLVTTYSGTTATGDPIGTNTSTCNYDITASSMKPNVSFNTTGDIAYVLTTNYRVTGSGAITVPVCGYCTLKPYGWTTSGWNSCTTVTKLTVSTTSPTNYPAATVTNFNVTTRSGALNNSYTNNGSTVYGIISPVTTTYRDSYVLTIVLTVTDSRGTTNSATTTVTVYSYTPPTLSLQAKRATINTNTNEVTEDAAGNYIIVKYFSILGSSLNSNNAVTNTCTCTIGNSTTTLPSGDTASSGWTPISWQSARWYYHILDSTSSATVTLSTVDKIISTAVTTKAYISVAKYPLDLYDNGAGTVGVGLGTLAESKFVKSALPIKTSFKDSIAMGSYQATSNTVSDLCNELRYSSGCSGSANITTRLTYSSKVVINTGWYNFIYSPHRFGGLSGEPASSDSDNYKYGTLILTGMNNSNGSFVIRIQDASPYYQRITKIYTTDWTPANDTTNLINLIYPVGSIYISTSSTNPGTTFGVGTWVAFGQGRVLVGVGTGTDSNSVSQSFSAEGTGGEYTHQLTTTEMPSHTHTIEDSTGQAKSEAYNGSGARSWELLDIGNSGGTNRALRAKATGGDGYHNNVQPYIAVYMWKRTA